MRKKKAAKKTSLQLLDVTRLNIKHLQVTKVPPKSAEVARMIEETKAEDPFQVGLPLSLSDVQYRHDKALMKLRAYLYYYAYLSLDKSNVERVNSDPDLKQSVHGLAEQFLKTHVDGVILDPDLKQRVQTTTPEEVELHLKFSATDFALQINALSWYARFLGMMTYDKAKSAMFQLRLKELVFQLMKDGHITQQGFMRLISQLNKQKSNRELRTLFSNSGITTPSIDKFFRENELRKQNQGQPQEFRIYQDENQEFYYGNAPLKKDHKEIKREIFDEDEAFDLVSKLNAMKPA
jgi:hypothetical protein